MTENKQKRRRLRLASSSDSSSDSLSNVSSDWELKEIKQTDGDTPLSLKQKKRAWNMHSYYKYPEFQEQNNSETDESFSSDHQPDRSAALHDPLHYSDHEAKVVAGNLRNENTFHGALYQLNTWLKQGECTKKNASIIFSLLNSVNSHVFHLVGKKDANEEKFNNVKSNLMHYLRKTDMVFFNIEEVFNSARKQISWNHFTKYQRKNIKLWEKHFKEWRDHFAEDLASYETDFEEQRSQLEKEVAELRGKNDVLISQLKVSEEEKNKVIYEYEQKIKQCESSLYQYVQEAMKSPVLQLTKSVLFSTSNESCSYPSKSKKPLGCKTVCVSGVPEKANEEIMKEVFERCGTVESIEIVEKNTCFVRFSNELYVENAMHFSGYCMKIENQNEVPYTGTLHVDYAQMQDSQNDKQNVSQEQDCSRTVSPIEIHCTDDENETVDLSLSHSVGNYSSQEASVLLQKLRYRKTLLQWLLKQESIQENASTFYNMIQSVVTHAKEVHIIKDHYNKQSIDAKKAYIKQLKEIVHEFTEIENIFKEITLCYNYFSGAQKKNIEIWKRETAEYITDIEKLSNELDNIEAEFCDGDDSKENASKSSELLSHQLEEKISKLSEEHDALKCQLRGIQNKIKTMQSDHKEELKQLNNQLVAVQQDLQKTDKEVVNLSRTCCRNEADMGENCKFRSQRIEDKNRDTDSDIRSVSSSSSITTENEARLISLISTFLHFQPYGADINSICSYLHDTYHTTKLDGDVENLMKKYSSIYKKDSSAIEGSVKGKWHFIGFQTKG